MLRVYLVLSKITIWATCGVNMFYLSKADKLLFNKKFDIYLCNRTSTESCVMCFCQIKVDKSFRMC